MTDRLQEIRDLLNKATRGPWVAYPTVGRTDLDNDGAWEISRPYCDQGADTRTGQQCEPDCCAHVLTTGYCDEDNVRPDDAQFMACAREDVEFLLAVVERVRDLAMMGGQSAGHIRRQITGVLADAGLVYDGSPKAEPDLTQDPTILVIGDDEGATP